MAIRAEVLTTEFRGDDRDLNRAFQNAERRTEQHVRTVNRTLSSIGRDVQTIAGGGGFLPGLANITEIIGGLPQIGQLARSLVRPLTDAAEAGVRFNAWLETSSIGFTTLLGSADKAREHLEALRRFATTTPFQFRDLVTASRQMQAMGFEASRVIPILTSVGDALSAAGEISGDSLLRVLHQLSQIQAKGRVMSEDMRTLADNGIPAWNLLATAIGKTVAETRRLAEAGRLRGPEAVEAITAMMSRRWGGQMGRVSGTLTGRLSNLADVLEFAGGRATEGLTANISEIVGAGLQREDLINTLTDTINTAITPVAGMVRLAAVGVLGGGLTSGLLEGINAGKAAVSEAVRDFALDSIVGTAKRFLGIESPSRVFYELGVNSGEGYLLGLRDSLGGGEIAALLNSAILQGRGRQRVDPDLLRRAARDPRVRAFTDTITWAEGGAPNIMAGGGRSNQNDPRHPGEYVPRSRWFRGPAGSSSASGNFQITVTNWRRIAPILGLTNFNDPEQQRMAALYLLEEGGGVSSLMRGDVGGAIRAASPWAAMPGSHLPGRQRSMSDFMGRFNNALQRMDVQATTVYVGGDIQMRTGEYHPGGYGGITENPALAWDRSTFRSLPLNPSALRMMMPGGTFGNYLSGGSMVPMTGALPPVMPGTANFSTTQNTPLTPQEVEQWSKRVIMTGNQTWMDLRQGFESVFINAFSSIEGGFKGMTGRFLIGFSTMLQQMALQALAANLGKAIFGNMDAQGGGSGGWLQKIFGVVLGAFSGGMGGGGAAGAHAGFHGMAFQHGGMVPGYPGQPRLAMVHGGEMVLNREQQRAVGNTTVINFNYTPRAADNFVQKKSQREIWDAITGYARMRAS